MTAKSNEMMEYSKMILEKVSFSRDLFRKELEKTKRKLQDDELELFRRWCNLLFTEKYPDIILEVFGSRTC